MLKTEVPRQILSHGGREKEISPEEAAGLLAISARSIRYLISEQKIRATKVNGRWFVDYASVLSYRDREVTIKQPYDADQRGPRTLAPYRLFLHATETLDFHSGHVALDSRVSQLKMRVLETLGAGFYSYGEEKKFQYRAARAMIGRILGLLYPYKDKSAGLLRVTQFLEEECIPSLASLSRKLENKKPQQNLHA